MKRRIVIAGTFIAQASILIGLVVLLNSCGSTMAPIPPTIAAAPAPTLPPNAAPTPAAATNTAINAEPAAELEQVAALDLPGSSVNTLVFLPDGHTLVTADLNGEVLLWDRETWEKSAYLPARSTRAADDAARIAYFGTLATSPDGNLIVQAYGEDGEVTGRDLAGEELFTLSYGARVYSLAISPDGRFLAVSGVKENVLIFDLQTKQLAADLPSDHKVVWNLVFSPDGRMLLASYNDPESLLVMWDTTSWQAADTIPLPSTMRAVHDVIFSPDGAQLVLALMDDPEIQFLDLATQQIVKEFPEHGWASYQIAYSPDGSLLASAGDDRTVRLWDLQTGANIKTIRASGEVWTVAFSPDGTLLAFSVRGGGVQVWAMPAAKSVSWLSTDSIIEKDARRER